jgi:hypothetical protein
MLPGNALMFVAECLRNATNLKKIVFKDHSK